MNHPMNFSPDNAKQHYNLGRSYVEQGKLDEAIKEFQEAIRIDPDYACAHCRLGMVYGSKGKSDLKIAQYRKTIETKQDCAVVHFNLAVCYARSDPEEAINEYKAAISIDPGYSEAHRNLGSIYRDQGKLDDAVKEYQEAIRIDSDDASSHHFLGHVYFDKSMFHEALAEWKRTIELTPDDARLYRDLRNAYLKMGRLEQLVEETQQKLKADPEDARGHYLLALALTERWETELAIESFRKAIELDPSCEAAHKDYIDLMKSRGRHAEVLAEYEQKARIQPDNELWGKMLEYLPVTRKRLIPLRCVLCIGRGVFNLAYLQFILLAKVSAAIESFALGLVSSPYLALIIYTAIISAIWLPFAAIQAIGRFKRAAKTTSNLSLSPALKRGLNIMVFLIIQFGYVLVAIIVYAAMQIFHANWWLPVAALNILYSRALWKTRSISENYLMKGRPIEDPILAERLAKLVEKSEVRVRDILRIDKADTPAKAQGGVLFPRRIMIGDFFLQRASIPEIEAVFAHELGHFKSYAMQKQFLVRSALVFIRLYLASLIYGMLMPAYGFSTPHRIAALPLLAFCWLILGVPIRAIQSWTSRHFEKKADRYGISLVGRSLYLSTLSKITEQPQEEILSPIFNFVCHSHPCREKRLHISER
jgi:tetratricopeptide (TPR) repeat protein